MPYMLNDFASGGALVDTSADRLIAPYATLFVTATGIIRVETVDGDILPIPVNGVPFVIPYSVRRVFSSGTTIPPGNVFTCKLT